MKARKGVKNKMFGEINSKSSKMLADEHVNILKVVEALEREVNELRKGKKVDEEFLRNVIDFIRNYADKFHHAKEEDILFKEFCKNDTGEIHCNPVEQMLYEHDIGRKAIKKIEQGMKEKSIKLIIEGASEYVTLIKEHIFKEDNILYPMADNSLNKLTKDKMFKEFQKINQERDVKKQLNFLKSLKNKHG